MEERRYGYRAWEVKPEGERHSWENSIKMDGEEIRWVQMELVWLRTGKSGMLL
jgi:hypothetical protein